MALQLFRNTGLLEVGTHYDSPPMVITPTFHITQSTGPSTDLITLMSQLAA